MALGGKPRIAGNPPARIGVTYSSRPTSVLPSIAGLVPVSNSARLTDVAMLRSATEQWTHSHRDDTTSPRVGLGAGGLDGTGEQESGRRRAPHRQPVAPDPKLEGMRCHSSIRIGSEPPGQLRRIGLDHLSSAIVVELDNAVGALEGRGCFTDTLGPFIYRGKPGEQGVELRIQQCADCSSRFWGSAVAGHKLYTIISGRSKLDFREDLR